MRKWIIKKEKRSLNLLDDLLNLRGVKPEEKEAFLYADYEKDIYDPFLFLDMEKAVKRIKKAIDENQKIIIFGDYDADGICGTVIISDFFRKVGFLNFEVYIPDRYKEGYGLKKEHIEDFLNKKASIIITIDCGITNYNEIKYAKSEGVDMIVLDHHIVPPKWPPAYAILNPKKEDEKYPYKWICGTALAFKLVDALAKKYEWGFVEGWQKWLLDVVAIATIADMVPLTGENRVLVKYGLKVLSKTKRKGLRELYKNIGIRSRKLTTDDIGFLIAPRINAASRMAHAMISYNLLTTDSQEEAKRLAIHLEEINKDRKKRVLEILDESFSIVENNPKEYIFIGNPSWPPGLLGIIANRLMEKYEKPAFIWGGGDSDYKGSCRGSGNINLVDVMRNAGEGLLKNFGGHAFSGGFAIEPGNIDKFEKNIMEEFKKIDYRLESDLVLDTELNIEDATEENLNYVKEIEPTGIENPKPIFLFSSLLPLDIKELGGRNNLKFTFKKKDGKIISAIGFSLNQWKDKVSNEKPIDLAASLEESHWNGRREFRLHIHDIRTSRYE